MGKISVISIYKPSDSPRINSSSWSNFFSKFKGHTIIGGDFNLPNDQILSLLDGTLNLDFVSLNDNSPTFWNGERDHYSILDLTFTNSALGLKASWSVHNDLWGSDHFPILIQFNVNISQKAKISRPKVYNSKTDWELFPTLVESDLKEYTQDLLNVSDIQFLYSTFIALIIDCLQRATKHTHLLSYKDYPKKKNLTRTKRKTTITMTKDLLQSKLVNSNLNLIDNNNPQNSKNRSNKVNKNAHGGTGNVIF